MTTASDEPIARSRHPCCRSVVGGAAHTVASTAIATTIKTAVTRRLTVTNFTRCRNDEEGGGRELHDLPSESTGNKV
jgi:hypothetical protein